MTKRDQDETTIYNDLFEHRIIVIDGEIVEALHTEVMGRLLLLNQKDPSRRKPIYILINSEGGASYMTLGLIDIIKSSPCPVHTICTGIAASSAAMILAAGHKRFATKASSIMVHQHWVLLPDLTHHELLNEAKESERLNKDITEFFIDVTGLPKKKIDSLLIKDSWLSAFQAKELNLIDEVGFDIFSILKKSV